MTSTPQPPPDEQGSALPAVHEAWLPREHAMHRPRHGGRQLTALISALVFFAAPAFMWVFGGRPGEIENRPLAAFPSLAAGWEFFTGLPAWATDQLVFRSGAVEAADGISRGVFGEPAPFGQDQSRTGPLPGSPPPVQAEPGEKPPGEADDQTGYPRVIEGDDGWLYFGADIEAKCAPLRPVPETLARIDELREAVESSGRQFVLVVAPDKTTMVPNRLPEDYPGKDCSVPATGKFWQAIADHGQIVDLRPRLYAMTEQLDRPVYYRNDTHWTDEGAIALTREIAEALQPGITESWETVNAGWTIASADLPPMLGREEKKVSLRYELRPDGETDRTVPPLANLERPNRHTAPPMAGTISRPALVFGDSFALASSRYLPAGFSELTVLGYPALEKYRKDAIKAFVDAEVVVVESVERSVAGGDLPFIDQGFVAEVRQAMAEQPVR